MHWSHYGEMPPPGFLSALKMRAQDATGGLPPDGSAIFMHAVRPCRHAALYTRRTDFQSLQDNTNNGHVLALHDSITRDNQARLDLEVLSEETTETLI
jgi:hypothetical protein